MDLTDRAPRRIQRERKKGWRLPEGAVIVTRPTRWGNPFGVGELVRQTPDGYAKSYAGRLPPGLYTAEDGSPFEIRPVADRADAADLFRVHLLRYPALLLPPIRQHLRGHDLACWCPLTDAYGNPVACHADVLLRVAAGQEP
ncbi:hypothetical protein Cme02nite_34950 [Catellatospora methionotrophica]|uniref:DUF4326 domain-containing protein n=1 Tax=Catellatospora methionotrophica TaxID=121620 RepID=A0A8J3LBK3_9ACTN|nr:DUF4326 domain-containing protein [Catellatospora methionotrophica]GIG15163.1 hypothetical protein Cme02nite_34950 [Catellatospora methionotrophica]